MNDARFAAEHVSRVFGVTSVLAIRTGNGFCDRSYKGDVAHRSVLELFVSMLGQAAKLGEKLLATRLSEITMYGMWQQQNDLLGRIVVAFPNGAPATKSLGRAIGRAWTTKHGTGRR